VLADFIFERELALFDQEHDGGGGDLLRDRPYLEDRLRRDGHVEFDVRQPVAAFLDNLAVPDDRQSEAGHVPQTHLFEDVIVHLVGARRRYEHTGEEHEGGEKFSPGVHQSSLVVGGRSRKHSERVNHRVRNPRRGYG
jgi:hypothetical protein